MKIKNVMKVIIILFLITSLMYVYMPTISKASKQDRVQKVLDEYGDEEPEPMPDVDKGSTSETEKTEKKSDEIRYVYFYTTISGFVYEEKGNNAIKTPVAGVEVSCGNASTVTGEDGKFSLTPGKSGSYSLNFKYGDINVLEKYNVSLTTDEVLAHNGYDYIVTQMPTEEYKTAISIEEREILASGKGAAQVILAVDCSYSTRHTNVEGSTKTQLELIVEATKNLVNTLLESGDNIYISIVAFAGNATRVTKLTNNADVLNLELDNLLKKTDKDWKPGTNVIEALEKSNDTFYIKNGKENTNRNIILISDGVPSTDGTNRVSSSYSTDQNINLLNNKIGPNTKKKVKELTEEGVRIMTLLTKSDDSEENEFVKSIYQENVNLYKTIEEGSLLAEAIEKDIKTYVIENLKETTYDSDSIVITGYENATRRKIVDSYFAKNKFYYNASIDSKGNQTDLSGKTSLFLETERAYEYEKARELSEKTYMTASCGTYQFDYNHYDGEEIKSKKVSYSYKDKNGNTVNDTYTIKYVYKKRNI